jgi:hypothetical protein
LVVHRLAGLIEEACVVGNVQEIRLLTKQLAIRIRRLQDAAPSASDAAAADEESRTAATAPALGADEVLNLARMLRLQTQSSIDLFRALAPQLRQRLGTSPYEMLREQVDTLQFAAAAAVLESC